MVSSTVDSLPGRYIDDHLQTGEQILLRTRLSRWLLIRALFNLLVGSIFLLSALLLAFSAYWDAQVPVLQWLFSPLGIIMLLATAFNLVPGIDNLLAYRSSEVAITSCRLLGQGTFRFRSKTFDVPLSSITKADFSPNLLGSNGDIRVSISTGNVLHIPSVPRALEFIKLLKAKIPAQPAAPK